MKKLLTDTQILSKPITKGMVSAFGSPAISAKGAYERAVVFFRLLAGEQDWFSGYDRAMNDVFEMSDGDKVVEWIIKMYSSSPRIRNLVDSHPNRKQFLFLDKVRANPPFYAHNLYEKKTHGLNLKQMRRLYAMVSRGNRKAITYARNVLGIPFSESPTQVKAVVYHHVRDLAERRVRRNPARSHRERIAIDTVRHPMKGYFLGGPDLAESVRYLRSLGYSMAQLKKLNPEVEDILEGRKSILPNRRKGPVTEREIRAMYRRHGVGLSQRGMFGKGYDAVSQYGYSMGKGPYKTAKEAERYVIKFYKKRPRLVRQ